MISNAKERIDFIDDPHEGDQCIFDLRQNSIKPGNI